MKNFLSVLKVLVVMASVTFVIVVGTCSTAVAADAVVLVQDSFENADGSPTIGVAEGYWSAVPTQYYPTPTIDIDSTEASEGTKSLRVDSVQVSWNHVRCVYAASNFPEGMTLTMSADLYMPNGEYVEMHANQEDPYGGATTDTYLWSETTSDWVTCARMSNPWVSTGGRVIVTFSWLHYNSAGASVWYDNLVIKGTPPDYDRDGDGVLNYIEIAGGWDPDDPNSNPMVDLYNCLNPPCPTVAEAMNEVGNAADLACPQDENYKNHGVYVSCVSHAVETALTTLPSGCFTASELEEISSAVVSARARLPLGKK